MKSLMSKSRLVNMLALLMILFFSCRGGDKNGTPTSQNITPRQKSIEKTIAPPSTPAATATDIPPKNLAPVIDALWLEPGSLCANAQAIVQYMSKDPEGEPLELNWHVQHGNLTQDADTFVYTAPAVLPKDGFDEVTLIVSDGENSSSASTLVKILNPDVNTAWEQTVGPEGGFITSIEINHSNPDVLYAAGAGGRVLKTINGGESWQPMAQFLEFGQGIGQLFLNQDNTDILYAVSANVDKSEDGGETFKTVLRTLAGISRASMSPFDPDVLLVGTLDGKLLHTDDGGAYWSNLNFPLPADSTINAVGISSNEEFWVGTREWSDQAGGQLFHTSDRGNQWTEVDNMNQHPDSDIQSVLVDPLKPETVYVSLMHSYNEMFDETNPRVVFKTANGGMSWEALPLPEVWDTSIRLMGLTEYDRTLYIGLGGERMYKASEGGETLETIKLLGKNGDIEDIAIDPRDVDVLYIPTLGAGILKSTNGGKTFAWKNNGLMFTAVSLLEMEEGAGSGVLYATTAQGDGQFRSFDFGDSWQRITENGITHPWADEIQINPHRPNEVWYVGDVGIVEVSKDRGDTWEDVIDPHGGDFTFGSVYALAADPSNPGRVYSVKNGFGIFSHEDWIRNPGARRFFHRSEVDYSFSLAVHPENENIIVSGYIPKPFQNYAWVRATWDGGESWETVKQVDGSEGITSVAFSPAMPDRFYFASVGTQPEIYRSDEFGGEDVALPSPWDLSQIEGEVLDYIEVVPHPSQPDTVYVGAYPAGVYISEDAGFTWREIDRGLPVYSVKDGMRQGRYNLVVAPSNPEILYVGIYGQGVFKSADGGSSWQNTGKIGSQKILAAIVSPEDENLVYIGTEKGVYHSRNGGDTWSEFMQDIQGIQVRTLAWGADGTLFAGTLGYEIYALIPGEDRWKPLAGVANFGTFWPIWNDRPLYQYTSLIFHPQDPDVIVIGTFPAGIYISRDGGKSWVESNTNWSWDGVFTLAYHPNDSNILYAGTYNGLNRSLDGGLTWEFWDAGWPDEQWTFSIEFDPRDPDVMYAAAKNGENEGTGQPGFFMGSVMKSTDGGQNWFEIMRGLPKDQEYYEIIVDPNTPDVLYLASQNEGVYISRDTGNSWSSWNEGLTNLIAGTNGNNVTKTMMLSPDGVHLYFATAGSGVFRRLTVNALQIADCKP
jgi:photosystem II stability/assembly factor-like uncharacterized protein